VIGPTVQIARDPFARYDLIRRQEPPVTGGCAWCGGHNWTGKLFRYGTWSDGGRQHWQDKLFCSVGCMRSYHNID
jgi:hypothetical protein